MEREVILYALIDPITLKVRYIGRTSGSLKKRLGEHICKAKLNHNRTYKENWIRSLLKVNSKPYIRRLTTVSGWKESHKVEKELIKRYASRLLNHDDRGEGSIGHRYTEEQKQNLSEKLKEHYSTRIQHTCKQVHMYGFDGQYLESFHSIKVASETTGIPYSTIMKIVTGSSKIPLRTKIQFSYSKLPEMTDYTRKENRRRRPSQKRLGV